MRWFATCAALFIGSVATAQTIRGKIASKQPIDPETTVVYLESLQPLNIVFKPTIARLSQKNSVFRPAVLPIVKGSRVDMTNDDWVEHSVFSMSLTKVFDLGLYSAQARPLILFDKAGVVELGCSIHPQMGAVILVLDNPFFTRPASDGSFGLKNVTMGSYRIKVFRKGREDSDF